MPGGKKIQSPHSWPSHSLTASSSTPNLCPGLSSQEIGLPQEWSLVEEDSDEPQVSWGFLLFYKCPALQNSVGFHSPSFS